MTQHVVDLTLHPESAFFILTKAREFEAKTPETDPDTGSNPSDDGAVDMLEMREDDPTVAEIEATVAALSIDAQRDLLALIWLGRGDYTVGEWDEARRQARLTEPLHVASYLIETPLASDYLAEALSALGYTQEDFQG